MNKDIGWKGYLADNDRYADIINGVCCKGRQMVTGDDLKELDTQTGFLQKLNRGIKIRDTLRKAAFGVNFAIIGIENQENLDYSMPLRSMSYDTGEYEKQAAKIRRKNRKKLKDLRGSEYLYGFGKKDRLNPVITLIIYSGEEEWNEPESLHEMIDFTDIPENMINMVQDYKVNLIEIRKLTDTSIFKTDVRQVFDFIRCSKDKAALKNLVEGDEAYKSMEEDAYEVVAQYTNATELIEAKEDYYGKDGKVDMCKALKELIEDGRAEGREEGLRALVFSLSLLLPSIDAVHQAIIRNEDYKNVSKEQVMKYYKLKTTF
ncbi:MAG: Rpn family recombination-promoting nuclease/putative transposase [Clostridiales bacterium]|nr:Rpn family recombination-promoting nuclease/putative transposase [Clostridiales bacterium]